MPPFALEFPIALYNSFAHIQTQVEQEKKIVSFILNRKSSDRIIGFFHCTESLTGWISPAKAPFGGCEFARDCPVDASTFMLDCILDFIKNQSSGSLAIKIPSAVYHKPSLEFYLAAGFEVLETQTNFHIAVSKQPLANFISPQERRRLKKCKSSGLTVQLNALTVDQVCNFLERSREIYGYRLSIDVWSLKILFDTFPDRFFVFSICDGGRIVALTVAVIVDERVLYNFLPADDPDYRSLSPMVLIYEKLFNFCQNRHMEILDLGTALDGIGHFKPSLARFKKNMGATQSEKITVTRTF